MGLLVCTCLWMSSFKARMVFLAQRYTTVINHASGVNQKTSGTARSKTMNQPTVWRNLIQLWSHSTSSVTNWSGISDFWVHIPSICWHIKVCTPREPLHYFPSFCPSALSNPKRDKHLLLYSISACTGNSQVVSLLMFSHYTFAWTWNSSSRFN